MKKSLQYELSLKICILFISVIFAVSSATIIYMSSQYNKIIIQNMYNNMKNVVDSIDSYFSDVKTQMVMLARNKIILRAVKDYQNMTNKEKLETSNSLKDFVKNITAFKPFINDIIIIGSNGYLYNIYNDSPDKYLNNFDFHDSNYLKDAAEGIIKLYFVGQHSTEYYTSFLPGGSKVYSVVLPVKTGRQKSYIMCDIKADIINDIFKTLGKDKNIKILIQNERGNLIYEEGDNRIPAGEIIETGDSRNVNSFPNKNILEILFSKGNYIIQIKSETTGWTYTYAEAYKNFNGFIKKIFFINFIIVIIASAVTIFFVKQLSTQILIPLRNIAFSIQKMKVNQGENKNDIFYIQEQNVLKLSIEIEKMIQRIDKLINENYMFNLKVKDAQIQTLENQITPHFLYNTLQLIEYQSNHNQKENITKIINSLSDILRYSLSSANTVILSEELNYICSYLDIYCLRYRNKLEYEIICNNDLKNALIPKMIIEPVVENCIKHGFAGNYENAQIRVAVFQENQTLYIAIRDNGKGITEGNLTKLREDLEEIALHEKHIGLHNIHSIIKLRYGESFGISIESRLGEFTEVTLHIPLFLEQIQGIYES